MSDDKKLDTIQETLELILWEIRNKKEQEAEAQVGEDELYEEAKQAVRKSKNASASFLQRKFKIGYARAMRLIDMMEDDELISSADGVQPRKILK